MEQRTSKRAKEMLCDEIEKVIGDGNLNRERLELLHKLTDTLKNLFKIEMYENESGYSHDGRGHLDRRYAHDSSYGDSSYDSGYSGRRRHHVRGHYSYDDGREEMIGKLDTLMNDAPTEKDREAIRRCMNLMQNM
ncbi:MAG: hypothetical protein K2G04_09715 [Oscillospiraceae bacterium]|nr:hypothetical protein [Oscillospiraceae bacterium]